MKTNIFIKMWGFCFRNRECTNPTPTDGKADCDGEHYQLESCDHCKFMKR